ncbi:uncharacterized protein LOC118086966 [Zootoca vivipara]|uniref:uncharacterized protein LOC118086966 n=1 Tax=Zootoca vivipara TaxID=8524 RepID=UPI001592921B|nr:uncharacterized protein LOC118086966 [Zootoca vivipara]
MASVLSTVLQWSLSIVIPWFTAQLWRFMNKLLTVAVVVALAVLLSTMWLAVNKADYSPMGTDHEVAVTTKQLWKPTSVLSIMKDALLYVANLLPSYEPLTVENLLRHRDRLDGVNYILQACFTKAIDTFLQEPWSVQQNAQLVIQCDGPPIEFRSGKGDCQISVYVIKKRIQCDIKERTAEMYLARLANHKEPLSVGDLLRVRQSLRSWGVLSEELGHCLEFAVEEFAKEPFCVQDNAYMVVDCGGQVLNFASGEGENKINIYDVRGGLIHYRIRISGSWTSIVRFFHGNKDHVQTHARKPLQLE